MNVLGIRVRHDSRLKRVLCHSRGVWPFKCIVVSDAFRRFPDREQQAMLLHEAGHCKMFHLEKRLLRLWMLLWNPALLASYCRAQEFQADRFAAECGYASDLAQAFARMESTQCSLHPETRARIERLRAWPSKV